MTEVIQINRKISIKYAAKLNKNKKKMPVKGLAMLQTKHGQCKVNTTQDL
jgi:hypothetical protein